MDKNSIQYKAVLLAVVSAVAGALLAAVNAITAPIIEENNLATIKATLEEFYPGASFKDVTDSYAADYDLVDGVYEAEGKGYIFTLHSTGYSSDGFTFIIAFDNDGKVSGYAGLQNNETAGKGSKCFEDDYINDVKALTSTDTMPIISGATVTSTAVNAAVTQAETIFNSIQGIAFDADANTPATPEPDVAETLGTTDISEATVVDNGDGTYTVTAPGAMGDNTATVTVADGAVVSITGLDGADKDGYMDDFFEDGGLAAYEGATADSVIDFVSGATGTSKSCNMIAAAALQAAAE